jgi:hypothetical protein
MPNASHRADWVSTKSTPITSAPLSRFTSALIGPTPISTTVLSDEIRADIFSHVYNIRDLILA